MWPFQKKSGELAAMQIYLQQSFSSVQNDSQRLHQWLQFLYQKTQQQDQVIAQLQQRLHTLPVNTAEIRNVIESHFPLQEIHQRVLTIQQHLEDVKRNSTQHDDRLATLQARLDQLRGMTQERKVVAEPSKKTHFQEKIVKNISRQSKSYLRSMLHNLIDKYQRISALQLKQIMVDEQKVCSKSSFYRLIDDLERDDAVGTLIDSRQKFFLSKPLRKA